MRWYYEMTLKQKIRNKRIKVFKKVATMISLTCVIIVATTTLGYFYSSKNSGIKGAENNIYPAIVPLLNKSEHCEEPKKAAKYEECLDYNHNPNF